MSRAQIVAAIKNPAGLYDPSPFGYSHVASVQAGARLVFVAGQGGEDEHGAQKSNDFATQLDRAFGDVRTALRSEGLDLDAIVKLTVLVVDHSQERLAMLAGTVQRLFPHQAPTCTLIPVPRLAVEGMLVEVDAIAAGPSGGS